MEPSHDSDNIDTAEVVGSNPGSVTPPCMENRLGERDWDGALLCQGTGEPCSCSRNYGEKWSQSYRGFHDRNGRNTDRFYFGQTPGKKENLVTITSTIRWACDHLGNPKFGSLKLKKGHLAKNGRFNN